VERFVPAAAAGNQADLAGNGGILTGDVLGVGADGHKVCVGKTESFHGFIHNSAGIIDELFHGRLLGSRCFIDIGQDVL
jgi:hypothetical protein